MPLGTEAVTMSRESLCRVLFLWGSGTIPSIRPLGDRPRFPLQRQKKAKWLVENVVCPRAERDG